MSSGLLMRALGHACLALSLFACQATPAVQQGPAAPAFTVDRQQLVARLADPPVVDWSLGRIANADVDAARKRHAQASQAGVRKLQAITTAATSATSAAPFSASGGISSAPAFNIFTDLAYWLTDTGFLLKYEVLSSGGGAPTAGSGAAWAVKTTGGAAQTFKNSQVSLSSDGRRVYLTSLEGNFLILDAATGAALYSYNVGRNTYFTNTGGTPAPDAMPAPFVDYVASRPDGAFETVYVVGNSGSSASNACTLHRFSVTQLPTDATPTVARTQGYSIAMTNAAPYVEGVRASPIVFNGYAVIGTWKRHSSNAKLDTGNVLYYDTGCRTGSTNTTTPGATVTTGVPNPVWAAPAVDIDDGGTPFMAFVSGDYQVTGVHLATGQKGQSPPLLVDQSTVPTIDSTGATQSPASSLSNYPYSNTGVQTVTLNPVQDSASLYSAVTVSGDNTNLVGGSGTAGLTNNQTFWSYCSNDAGDSPQHPAYAYAMFRYTVADRYVGAENSPRGVNQIRVSLTNSISSNPDCCGQSYDSQVPAMEGWKVKSTLTTGAQWEVGTITPTNRPQMLTGGHAFTYANAKLNSHNLEKLIVDTGSNHYAGGNRFRSNSNPYNWLADGLVAEDEYATFAFYDDNDRLGNGKNNGKPHNTGTPYFEGGTSGNRPKLLLELSASGLLSPAMLAAPAIDSWDQQIYAVNTNALYRVSYQAFTNIGYTTASLPERFLSMADPQKTFYAHTNLGQNASYGPIATTSLTPAKRYVGNNTGPLLGPSKIYVQDNFVAANGTSSRTSITEYNYGTAPTATLGTGTPPARTGAVLDLTASVATAKSGPSLMVYDYESARLLTGTWDPATAANGQLWVLNK